MANGARAFDPEALLAHAGWLRALARALVEDPNSADDALQETLLAALAQPPAAIESQRSVRAWLARVLRNQVFASARARRHAEDRERRAARAEVLPAASEPILKLELEHELIEAIRALEPDDREVVALRYFEGLSNAEVAARTGSTDAAVRSRVSRALGKLRARLDRRFGGDRRGWAVALVEMATKRGAAPAAASSSFAVAALVIAVGIGATGAFIALRGHQFEGKDPQADEVALVPSIVGNSEATVESIPPPATAERAANERQVATHTAAASNPTSLPPSSLEKVRITARFVDAAGRPLSGVRLRAADVVGDPSVESDRDGRAVLVLDSPPAVTRGLRSLRVRLVADASGLTRQTRYFDPDRRDPIPVGVGPMASLVSPGEYSLGEIVLHPGGAIEGRVVDEHGQAVANAVVRPISALHEVGSAEEEERLVFGRFEWPFPDRFGVPVRTDAAGRYRLEGVAALDVSVAAKASWSLHGYTKAFPVLPEETARGPDLMLRVPSQENRIRGRVLDGDGTPVVAASVRLLASGEWENSNSWIECTTDAEGAFQHLVLRGQEYDFAFSRNGGPMQHRSDRQGPFPSGATDVELRFLGPRTIEIVVVDPVGDPVPKPGASCWDEKHQTLDIVLGNVDTPRLQILRPNRPFFVAVHAKGFFRQKSGPIDPATCPDTLRFEMRTDMRKAFVLRGRVTAQGVPVANARLDLHEFVLPGKQQVCDAFVSVVLAQPSEWAVTDAVGRFTMQPNGKGPFQLHAWHDGFARTTLGPLSPGAGSIEDLEVTLDQGGVIEGRLLVADGLDPAGMVVGVSRGDGHVHTREVKTNGVFRFEHLAAGPWQVRRFHSPRASQYERVGWHECFRLRREEPFAWNVDVAFAKVATCDVDVRDELPVSGRLSFDGRGASGWGWVLWAGPLPETGFLGPEGRFELRAVKPGSHTLRFSSPDARNQSIMISRKIELTRAGELFDLDLTTGMLELENIPPAAPVEWNTTGRPTPRFCLMWEAHGVTWLAQIIDSEEGRLVLTKVPAGHLLVMRRPDDRTTDSIDTWPTVLELDLRAGETKTVRLP